jgi:hypothetical protein
MPAASEGANTKAETPGRPRSSGGFARASMADWGRAPGTAVKGGASPGKIPRSSPNVSPGSVGGPALVVHSPVWSFDAAGMPSDRSTRPATARDAPTQSPPRMQPARQSECADTSAPARQSKKGKQAIGVAAEERPTLAEALHEQGAALDRSISFVCREVTSSLPDLSFAVAAAPAKPAPAAAMDALPAAAVQLAADAQPAPALSAPGAVEAGRNGAAGAKSGKAVTWQTSAAAAEFGFAATHQPPIAATDVAESSAAAVSSKQGTSAADNADVKGKAAAVQTVKTAASEAAPASAATMAVSTVSPLLKEAAQASAQATTEGKAAGACVPLKAAPAQRAESSSSPAGAQTSTATASAAAAKMKIDGSAADEARPAGKDASAEAIGAVGGTVASKAEIPGQPAAQEAVAVAAFAAPSVGNSAEAKAGFLSAAFSAPLPQSEVTIDWKPAAKSTASAANNPWSTPWSMGSDTAKFGSGAASGWGSRGVPSTPSPSKMSIDAETFHTAGDEVSDAGDTAESSLVQPAGTTDAPAGKEDPTDEPAEGNGQTEGEGEVKGRDSATVAADEKVAEGGGASEGGKGASLPQKCKSAIQSIKSTCEAVGSMAADISRVPSSCSGGEEIDDESAGDSSDDEAQAAGNDDSQWESGTSESAEESADESTAEADSASEAASGSDEDHEGSDGESTSAENPGGNLSAGLLRTLSTELDVDDIMSMTAADLDTRKIKGLSSCSVQATKVVSLEVFAGPPAVLAAAAQSSSELVRDCNHD